MCKETIEGSLKVEGVTKADWSPETKMISVAYDTTKITLDQIQKNIALVGYDNEKYKGDNATYSELPECCQYDRKP
jgi:mercuric ion binding protein